MNAWYAVIQELTAFVKEELKGLFGVYQNPLLLNNVAPQHQTPPSSLYSLPAPALASAPIPEAPSVIHPIIPDILHEPIVMYVSTSEALCFTHAHEDFDGVIMTYPYGVAVTVVSFFGRYARVLRQETVGWVLKDDLTQNKSLVWPALRTAVRYESNNDITQKIRLVIADTFRAGALNLPLQAGEYILYRLRLDNRVIDWPSIRPRLPGYWQKVLRGNTAIHIGITPKTDTIMEWFTGDRDGKLAYVEKVFPDGTIELSVVGNESPGEFNILKLPESQWRELHPVFIELK